MSAVGPTRRHGECAFHRPSTGKPNGDGVDVYACSLLPCSHTECFTIESYSPVYSTVALLILSQRPSAIVRAISKIIVVSFNCVLLRWPWTHILHKGLKPGPSLTNSNAATAIVGPGFEPCIGASHPHAAPDVIYGRVGLLMGRPGLPRCDHRLSPEASTTLSGTCLKKSISDEGDSSANAPAPPLDHLSFIDTIQDRQSIEDLPGKVSRVLVRPLWYIGLSHAVSSSSGEGVVRGRRSLSTTFGFAYFTSQCDGLSL